MRVSSSPAAVSSDRSRGALEPESAIGWDDGSVAEWRPDFTCTERASCPRRRRAVCKSTDLIRRSRDSILHRTNILVPLASILHRRNRLLKPVPSLSQQGQYPAPPNQYPGPSSRILHRRNRAVSIHRPIRRKQRYPQPYPSQAGQSAALSRPAGRPYPPAVWSAALSSAVSAGPHVPQKGWGCGE